MEEEEEGGGGLLGGGGEGGRQHKHQHQHQQGVYWSHLTQSKLSLFTIDMNDFDEDLYSVFHSEQLSPPLLTCSPSLAMMQF